MCLNLNCWRGVILQEKTLEKICAFLDKAGANKFKCFLSNNSQFVSESDLDKLLMFFNLLFAQKDYDFYSTGKLISCKKYAEDIGASVFEFLPNNQIKKFSGFCEKFYLQMQSIKKQAFESQIAQSKWVTDDVCRLLENEGKPMIIFTHEDKVFKGLVNVEPDREFNLYHYIVAEGSAHQLMTIKGIITYPNYECLYYNDFLNYLPPKQSYIKKFGVQVEMAFDQEDKYTNLGIKY